MTLLKVLLKTTKFCPNPKKLSYKTSRFKKNRGGILKWCNHYEKQYGSSSKKFKTELSYDPAIPLLNIYPKELK
jgi:hypothetical protein